MTTDEPIDSSTLTAIVGAVQAFLDLDYDSPLESRRRNRLRNKPNMWKHENSHHAGANVIRYWKFPLFSLSQTAKHKTRKMSWR